MSHRADHRSQQTEPGGVAAGVAAVGFAIWFWATVLSNHPVRTLDRVRLLDRWGVLLPNWRFFAPIPATYDFHVLYRVQEQDGTVGGWDEASAISRRTWGQTLFFPARRREKAVFDIVSALLLTMGRRGLRGIERTTSYRLLQSHVEHRVRAGHATALPRGFQFAVVQYSGYDEVPDPVYLLVSAFVPLALDGVRGPLAAAPAA